MSIFVSISCYEDWDVFNTIKSLYAQAENPDAIRTCVVFQSDCPADQLDAITAGFRHKWNVRFHAFRKDQAAGVGPPRHYAAKRILNEKYFLQLDAHHRFDKHWDTQTITLLETLRCNGHEKPILTAYMRSMTDQRIDRAGVISFRFAPYTRPSSQENFTPPAFCNPKGCLIDKAKFNNRPLPACHASGHFWFADGDWARECGVDPNYFFSGEEQSMCLRAFTRGYDLFHPHEWICSHQYGQKFTADTKSRRRIWDDRAWVWLPGGMNDKSIRRLSNLVGWEKGGVDLGEWGLGTERTLDDWADHSGVDYHSLTTKGEGNWEWINANIAKQKTLPALLSPELAALEKKVKAMSQDDRDAFLRKHFEQQQEQARRAAMPRATEEWLYGNCKDCGKSKISV